MDEKRKLPTSDIGTVVNKSKAKHYFPVDDTVFQKGSRLNRFRQNSTTKQEGGFYEIPLKLGLYTLIITVYAICLTVYVLMTAVL